ncbi:MAG: nuclear transport factor 2 family protein [Calothrix sp. MO_192.B10]|nr:nuclear transport factor 2 family protein [Calothrix sp. MO_192.B10]
MNNVDIIKSLYKSFAAGDIDAVLGILAEDVEWIESDGIPYEGTFRGHEAIINGVFAKIGSEWSNFNAHVDEFIDAGDIVITLGVDSGTYNATGKSMQAPTASIWRLKDGKVVQFRQYIDTLAVAKAAQL